jgi:hypothetical protein
MVRRMQIVQRDSADYRRFTLVQAQAELREQATLGDLLQGEHRSQSLTRSTAALLNDMDELAGCLHAEFTQIAPIIRLQWAEILSQFDRPTALHSLSILPQWGQVARSTRRALQGLVDWFYAQIDRDNAKPVDLVDNLVRIAILMAAHAPVKRLIPARLITESPARIGSMILLAVDTNMVRRGMTTLIRDRRDQIISRAVIDDMRDGQASARIISVAQNITMISQDMRIELASQTMRLLR